MHEFGLCEGVVEAVRRRAAGRPVQRVRLRIGVRHAAEAASMEQAFQLLAEGTEADSATLVLVTIPARLACRSCGASTDTTDLLALCPSCGGDDVELSGGDELTLESLEYRWNSNTPS
jgi:hydrogenase nickel incorporation protein HypA/HybF